MQTSQSLTKYKTGAVGIPDVVISGTEKEKPKDVTEYLVLQRRILRGEEGPWKIWGTTTETDIKKLAEAK